MDTESIELLDSMVESIVNDVNYQFDLSTDEESIYLILDSLIRKYPTIMESVLEKKLYVPFED